MFITSFYHYRDLNPNYKYDENTNRDNLKLTGEPDHSLFNKHESWEVLYMINKILSKVGTNGTYFSYGRKIEEIIHNHIPANFHSQLNVYNFIVGHIAINPFA